MIRPGENGALTWALPIAETSKFPLIAIQEDTGKFVTAALRNRDALLGARLLGATAYYTGREILDTLAKVTGKQTQFAQVPAEVYKAFLPEGMAQEFLENHLFIENPGYFNGEALEESQKFLSEKLTTLEEFLVENKGAF